MVSPASAQVRLTVAAIALGGAAGALAALTYIAMIALQEVIWHTVGPSRWVILPTTVLGGVLIGWTRMQSDGPDLEGQIAQTRASEMPRLRETFWLALGAIVAVGFGGAIGPEAGIIAVTGQLSAIVALRLGKTAADQRLLGEAGVAGALSGFYGSPAGGPVHAEPEGSVPKPILFVAGIAGFAAFLWLAEVLRDGAVELMWLPRFSAEAGRWDVVIAAVPAAAGALAGLAYLWTRAQIAASVEEHLPHRFWQPVAGGAALGLLCTISPLLLFSGHNELREVVQIGLEHGALPLVLLALGKALACAICIGCHWQGGVVFPMCFAGGALGGATLFVIPGFDPLIGIAAGMSAAAAVGMARPLVAGLVMLFILGGGLAIPVFVGTLIGWAVLQRVPARLTEGVLHAGNRKG